mmetsp:Transcript_33500/g.77259  ORF Transcript_33500/g.77259 Transcript_33500/m.77259 type:complete len:583 (-) Transcript_33500:88-1836(-)
MALFRHGTVVAVTITGAALSVPTAGFSFQHSCNARARCYLAVSPSSSARGRRLFSSRNAAVAVTTAEPSEPGEGPTEAPIFERFGAGVRRDFGRRLPLYRSDITDGLNAQSLATTLFLFFACLAPAIGFGVILGASTSGAMGTIEMVGSTALCGVVYALCSAQPVQLIGPMGPNLAFSVSLAQLARRLSLPFLPLYAWTGFWTAAILLAAALTSASNLVRYLTGFTDEIFSVLISTIFLVGAVQEVAQTFFLPTSTATKALLTLLCASITFITSIILKGCNKSAYFSERVRNNLSNFAPAVGVAVGSLVARAARLKYGAAAAALPALSLPAKFSTTTGRPWLVPLLDLPVWARWASCLPATLAAVLLFLDQNITARLVNNPRYRQVKGRDADSLLDGMHGDMLVLSLLTAATSALGLPWMAGATTRSAAHVRSLSISDRDGNITGTLENRVSGFAIHALIGGCVLLPAPRALLAQVPLPALSGIFLYLGLTSLQGLELWDRIRGLFQDSSVAPQRRWSAVVPKKVTNLFTVVQMACIYAMMKVKESSYGVVFPLIIALMPVLKYGLVKTGIISKESMDILDR